MTALDAEIRKRGLVGEVRVVQTGCRGLLLYGPRDDDIPRGHLLLPGPGGGRAGIVRADPAQGPARDRVSSTRSRPPPRRCRYLQRYPFYRKQMRIALRNCGFINPEKIDEYIASGGYEALGKALFEMTPEQIDRHDEERSGLRGRGGAGFLTGLKWEFCRKAQGDDQVHHLQRRRGRPRRVSWTARILEGDPHTRDRGHGDRRLRHRRAAGLRLLPRRISAGHPAPEDRHRDQAREYGLLGANILGSDFSFDIPVKEGAGAFVCGEETALIASIEGRRGEPRPRPPFPTTGRPVGQAHSINNVETWANVPPIIRTGAEWFASIGTEQARAPRCSP